MSQFEFTAIFFMNRFPGPWAQSIGIHIVVKWVTFMTGKISWFSWSAEERDGHCKLNSHHQELARMARTAHPHACCATYKVFVHEYSFGWHSFKSSSLPVFYLSFLDHFKALSWAALVQISKTFHRRQYHLFSPLYTWSKCSKCQGWYLAKVSCSTVLKHELAPSVGNLNLP